MYTISRASSKELSNLDDHDEIILDDLKKEIQKHTRDVQRIKEAIKKFKTDDEDDLFILNGICKELGLDEEKEDA